MEQFIHNHLTDLNTNLHVRGELVLPLCSVPTVASKDHTEPPGDGLRRPLPDAEGIAKTVSTSPRLRPRTMM